MSDEKDSAIDRVMVNLLVALSELDMLGNPRMTKAQGRKYVVLAIKELAAISPGFLGQLPKGLTVVRRSARASSP